MQPGNGWKTVTNLLLGAWLFFSPWILATTFNVASSVNFWIFGALVFLVAIAALRQRRPAGSKWLNAIFGAWTFLAPWILGFAGVAAAAWNAWIVGALIVILALWSVAQLGSQQPTAAHHA